MAYTIGHVSGCHINPAVTLGFLLSRKITPVQSLYYWVAQFAGAAVRRLADLRHHEERRPRQDTPTGPEIFAANGWGAKIGSQYGLGSVIVMEIVFTALLVFVVLVDDDRRLPDRLRWARRRAHARR